MHVRYWAMEEAYLKMYLDRVIRITPEEMSKANEILCAGG